MKSSKSKYDWGIISFIVGYHIALLIGLPIYFMNHSLSWQMGVASLALLYISGISITAGYHRLYAHQTYKTNKAIELFFLFFATLATQGSALKWASDHRKHHAFVDQEQDPYSIKKGFWYAHVLWLFYKAEPIDTKVVADLCKNKVLMFQHKYYGILMLLTNTMAFLAVGYLLDDYLGAFVFAWWVRLFFLHHFTWFINSLAHTWGHKPFSQEHSAVDTYLLSFFTFGEGYHNYHHTFASDYRNGVRWFQFDPAKWLIWALSKCKLAYGLRRVSHSRIQERIIIERKNELIEAIKNSLATNGKILEDKIETMTQEILSRFSRFYQLLQDYKTQKKEESPDRDRLKEISQELKSLKTTLKSDWKCLQRLTKDVALIASGRTVNLSGLSD